MSLLGPPISSTAADAARRAARFAQPLPPRDPSQRPAVARIPHPDAPAQLKGDPRQKLLEVVQERLAAGEEISAYQQSLLQGYGVSLADLAGKKARRRSLDGGSGKPSSGAKRRARAEAAAAGEEAAGAAAAAVAAAAAAAAPKAVAPSEGSSKAARRSYAAVTAASAAAAAAAAREEEAAAGAAAAAAAAEAASPSGSKSIPSLKKLARSLERLAARQRAGGAPLSKPEAQALAALPSVYDSLMARMAVQ
jgi:hypothetical protein